MKKYIHFFEEDFEEKGNQLEKGRIFALTDESNGLNNCVEIDLTEMQLENIFDHLYLNDVLIYDTEGVELKRVNALRDKRKVLLNAFDTYNINVTRGFIKENEEQKQAIVEWYQSILDLDENAINNPPERIKYYL